MKTFPFIASRLLDQITNLDFVRELKRKCWTSRAAFSFAASNKFPMMTCALLQSAARIIIDDEKGTLSQQLQYQKGIRRRWLLLFGSPPDSRQPMNPARCRSASCFFRTVLAVYYPRWSQIYSITLQPGQVTPKRLWVNVLANQIALETVISESGSAYTWAENSHEFRLTPWNNDPWPRTPPERLSTFAMSIRASSPGHPRRCQRAAQRPMSSATALVTLCSSMPENGIVSGDCGCMWRWMLR